MNGLIIQHQNKTGGLKLSNKGSSASITDLDISKLKPAVGIPPGIIIMFSGDSSFVPSNWAFCDGRRGTPDLRNRFILGGSGTRGGARGGSSSVGVVSHSHTGSKSSSAGSHKHTASYSGGTSTSSGNHSHRVAAASEEKIHLETIGYTNNNFNWGYGTEPTTWNGKHSHKVRVGTVSTNSTGSHKHTATMTTASGGSGSNLPPYYKLAFIMKVK